MATDAGCSGFQPAGGDLQTSSTRFCSSKYAKQRSREMANRSLAAEIYGWERR